MKKSRGQQVVEAEEAGIEGVVAALAAIPVSHVTERRGRPYTLVLKKLDALFKEAAALRAEQEALAAWISSERPVLAGDKKR